MGNSSFKGLKLEFQSLETNRFIKGNTLFSVRNRIFALATFSPVDSI